ASRERFRGYSIGTPVLKSLWAFRIAYIFAPFLKTPQNESAKRERGNPFGERSGTGYCYELNEPLRRPPPLLLLPKYLPVGLAIGIKAIMFTPFPSGNANDVRRNPVHGEAPVVLNWKTTPP